MSLIYLTNRVKNQNRETHSNLEMENGILIPKGFVRMSSLIHLNDYFALSPLLTN